VNDAIEVALFSDNGNGLHASRAVAKQIVDSQLPYAFHLGDVYYGGAQREFEDYFEAPLRGLLDRTELFLVAGNHEMFRPRRMVPAPGSAKTRAAPRAPAAVRRDVSPPWARLSDRRPSTRCSSAGIRAACASTIARTSASSACSRRGSPSARRSHRAHDDERALGSRIDQRDAAVPQPGQDDRRPRGPVVLGATSTTPRCSSRGDSTATAHHHAA